MSEFEGLAFDIDLMNQFSDKLNSAIDGAIADLGRLDSASERNAELEKRRLAKLYGATKELEDKKVAKIKENNNLEQRLNDNNTNRLLDQKARAAMKEMALINETDQKEVRAIKSRYSKLEKAAEKYYDDEENIIKKQIELNKSAQVAIVSTIKKRYDQINKLSQESANRRIRDQEQADAKQKVLDKRASDHRIAEQKRTDKQTLASWNRNAKQWEGIIKTGLGKSFAARFIPESIFGSEFAQNIAKKFIGIGTIAGNFLLSGIKYALMAGSGIIAAAIYTGSKFEHQLAGIAAISESRGKKLKAEMMVVESALRDMQTRLVFTASEGADALYKLVQAGFSTKDAIEGVEPALKLAAIAGSDLEMTTDLLASSLISMGEGAESAARYANIFAVALNISLLDMTKLSEAMKYAAPIAGATGQAIESVVGTIAEFVNMGFRGEMAGTAYRNAIIKLLHPTKEMARVLKGVGLTFNEINPMGQDFIAIINKLAKSTMSVSEVFQFFGVRAGLTIANIISKVRSSHKPFGEMTERLKKAVITLDEMYKRSQDSFIGSVKLLRNNLNETLLTLYDTMKGSLKPLIDHLTGLVKTFNASLKGDGADIANIFYKMADGARSLSDQMFLLMSGIGEGGGWIKFIAGIAEAGGLFIGTLAVTKNLIASMIVGTLGGMDAISNHIVFKWLIGKMFPDTKEMLEKSKKEYQDLLNTQKELNQGGVIAYLKYPEEFGSDWLKRQINNKAIEISQLEDLNKKHQKFIENMKVENQLLNDQKSARERLQNIIDAENLKELGIDKNIAFKNLTSEREQYLQDTFNEIYEIEKKYGDLGKAEKDAIGPLKEYKSAIEEISLAIDAMDSKISGLIAEDYPQTAVEAAVELRERLDPLLKNSSKYLLENTKKELKGMVRSLVPAKETVETISKPFDQYIAKIKETIETLKKEGLSDPEFSKMIGDLTVARAAAIDKFLHPKKGRGGADPLLSEFENFKKRYEELIRPETYSPEAVKRYEDFLADLLRAVEEWSPKFRKAMKPLIDELTAGATKRSAEELSKHIQEKLQEAADKLNPKKEYFPEAAGIISNFEGAQKITDELLKLKGATDADRRSIMEMVATGDDVALWSAVLQFYFKQINVEADKLNEKIDDLLSKEFTIRGGGAPTTLAEALRQAIAPPEERADKALKDYIKQLDEVTMTKEQWAKANERVKAGQLAVELSTKNAQLALEVGGHILESSIDTFANIMVSGFKNVRQELKNLGQEILHFLIEMILKTLIWAAIIKAIQGKMATKPGLGGVGGVATNAAVGSISSMAFNAVGASMGIPGMGAAGGYGALSKGVTGGVAPSGEGLTGSALSGAKSGTMPGTGSIGTMIGYGKPFYLEGGAITPAAPAMAWAGAAMSAYGLGRGIYRISTSSGGSRRGGFEGSKVPGAYLSRKYISSFQPTIDDLYEKYMSGDHSPKTFRLLEYFLKLQRMGLHDIPMKDRGSDLLHGFNLISAQAGAYLGENSYNGIVPVLAHKDESIISARETRAMGGRRFAAYANSGALRKDLGKPSTTIMMDNKPTVNVFINGDNKNPREIVKQIKDEIYKASEDGYLKISKKALRN